MGPPSLSPANVRDSLEHPLCTAMSQQVMAATSAFHCEERSGHGGLWDLTGQEESSQAAMPSSSMEPACCSSICGNRFITRCEGGMPCLSMYSVLFWRKARSCTEVWLEKVTGASLVRLWSSVSFPDCLTYFSQPPFEDGTTMFPQK